jgi:hypothetical protein
MATDLWLKPRRLTARVNTLRRAAGYSPVPSAEESVCFLRRDDVVGEPGQRNFLEKPLLYTNFGMASWRTSLCKINIGSSQVAYLTFSGSRAQSKNT